MKRKQQNTLLIIGALTLLTSTLISFSGCKKDKDVTPNNDSVVIKYQIVSSAYVIQGFSEPTSITYTNETGTPQPDYIKTKFTTWEKEVKVVTPQRPINVIFEASGKIDTLRPTVQMNIFVNGVLRGTLRPNIIYASTSTFSGVISNVIID